MLGLDFCADTLVGDAMRRDISRGQKKRFIVGHKNNNGEIVLYCNFVYCSIKYWGGTITKL